MLVSVLSTGMVYMLMSDLSSWEAVSEVAREGSASVTVTVPYNYATASIFNVPSGKRVVSVCANVTQAWNGTGPSVVVGTAPTGQQVLSTADVELDTVGAFQVEVLGVDGPVTIYVTNTPGVGTNTGSLSLRITVA
jgi:hypothetical protein